MEFTALKWKRNNYEVTIFSVFKIAIANNNRFLNLNFMKEKITLN